jgi:hypothetical protein
MLSKVGERENPPTSRYTYAGAMIMTDDASDDPRSWFCALLTRYRSRHLSSQFYALVLVSRGPEFRSTIALTPSEVLPSV